MKVLTAEEIRRAELWTAEHGTSLDVLMRNAAEATRSAALRFLGSGHRAVVIAAGPGNNGGDGLVAAALLVGDGIDVVAGVVKRKADPDLPLLQANTAGVRLVDLEESAGIRAFRDAVERSALVVDALFGTGNIRSIQGAAAAALKIFGGRPAGVPLLAVDLPSGLNADTGEVDDLTPTATRTVTFAFPKPGLYLFPGAERAGGMEIADIGIPAAAATQVKAELIDWEMAKRLVPPRPAGGHKGTFGKVLVVAGSTRYVGAAFLVCSAAGRSGSGIVTLATGESVYRLLAGRLVEPTFLPLPEQPAGTIGDSAAGIVISELEKYDSLVIGPGLGRAPATDAAVLRILQEVPVPAVIDADALNVLAASDRWEQLLPGDCVLTPHSGELARLLSIDIPTIERSRVETARRFAGRAGRTVILKGAHTIVADPDGGIFIQPIANPALSTGGTGDVLSGLIGGLLAQGLDTGSAARLGVYLHAAAGAAWSEYNGNAGLLASDLLPLIPGAMRVLRP